MTTQSKKDKAPSPKLIPDFKHRLSAFGDKPDSLDLVDAVNNLVLQSTNILALLKCQFAGSEEEKERVSDDVVYWSIDSAINTIKDIDAIVNAYHEAQEQTAGGAA